ncbi:BTAD domain-containing putative transcriptional regulator [Actinosynnema sp. NPDC053489]|uniref:BTAD domain-containing putative transcriptional regulator n=1 Tax=Actinosynnema sp. NPDC053489 TaxID=3363916 RepID=UPI0037CC64E0
MDGDRAVGLGGTRQRATLGFLLLHLNRVVATSQLLDALWADEAPVSARKILQNAIWGLRGALSSSGRTSESAALITQMPGYMLSADPSQVDLHGFHRLAEQGQSLLASRNFEEASRVLNEALGLWRGPALADLVETGLAWPELTVLQNLRLDVLEDYFEAELSCGRHHLVLGELERTVEARPLRERSCGQLMLALYRCGRQADALNLFTRVRSALVEELGLEPRRELQMLQHAILTHDETLTFTPTGLRQVIPLQVNRGALQPVPVAVPEAVAVGAPSASSREAGSAVLLDSPPPPAGPAPAFVALTRPDPDVEPVERSVPLQPFASSAVPAQRKQVSVLMVHTSVELGAEGSRFDVLDGVADTVREGVEYFGGTVAASIGSVAMALFDVPRQIDNSVERAVRAALAIRDCLNAQLESVAGAQVVVRAAVTTGEALVRYQATETGAPLSVNGAPVEECQSVLFHVPDGETWISDSARGETLLTVLCHQVAEHPQLWQVDGVRPESIPHDSVPVVDREPELELLRALMDRTMHRASPHLVTVLGAAGVGKTRFLMEFQRRVVGHPTAGQFVLAHAYWPDQDGVRALQAESVASCCGINPRDDSATIRDKLGATAKRHLPPNRAQAVWDMLMWLVAPECPTTAATMTDEITAAWRELMGAVARDRGMVLVIDDVQCADDRLLAFIEGLTRAFRGSRLLVLAAARSDLVERRPDWGGGLRHATTLALDPLSDEAIDRLLELLLTHGETGADGSPATAPAVLTPVSGHERDARREHIRMLLCLDRRMLTDSAAQIRSS